MPKQKSCSDGAHATQPYAYRHNAERRDREFLEWWDKVKRGFPAGFKKMAEMLAWEAWREGGVVDDKLGRSL